MSVPTSPLGAVAAAVAAALADPDFAALVAEQGASVASSAPPTMNVEQAAAFLHLPSATVRQYAREGRLIGYQAGRRWVFFREDLERALRTGQLAA